MKKTSHLDERGRVSMADVSAKKTTERRAEAEAVIIMRPETLRALLEGEGKKGDAFAAARIGGIMAAKKTADLIPLCHPLPLDHIALRFETDEKKGRIRIAAAVKTTARTGAEMEALTAAAIASLTLYDMAKSEEKGIRIESLRLLSKSGGKSKDFNADG